jgi:hypothetical protein
MFSDESTFLSPVNYFQINLDCHRLPKGDFPRLKGSSFKKHILPDTSTLCNQESFAEIAMGWNLEGIELCVKVEKRFEHASYPDVMRGDSFELFIDTRDVKTSGYNTRFCHHFFFLPEAIEGHHAGELTHFRTEDTHPLCDPGELHVKASLSREAYTLHLWIPKEVMHGYDPEQFKRMGFSYRVNRPRYESQHFSAKSSEFQLEQQPSLWSTMRLVE